MTRHLPQETDLDRVAAFLANLELIGNENRVDAFANEILEHGGIFPELPAGQPRYLFDMQLHGITAVGETIDTALERWTRKARAELACHGRGAA